MITPSEAGAAFTAGSCTLYIRKDTDHLTALRDFETIRKCMEVFINDRQRTDNHNEHQRLPAGHKNNPLDYDAFLRGVPLQPTGEDG